MTSTDLSRADDAVIDRRKLLKIGAWGAPAVILAAAVPAATASVGTTQSFTSPTVTIGGTKKSPQVTISGTASGAWVAVLTVTNAKSGDTWDDGAAGTAPQTKAGAGGTGTVTFPVFKKKDNGDRNYTLTVTINNVQVYSTSGTI